MKRKTISLLAVLCLFFIVVNGQSNARKTNPVGTWKFEAPYAPVEYSSGSAVVSNADNKYTVSMTFSDSQNIFKGEKVMFKNDSLFFAIYIEGQDVAMSLRV